MAERRGAGRSDANLRTLAMSHPVEAERQATAALRDPGPASDPSDALQALGIVARERGELSKAIRFFRSGVREAAAAGLLERRADLLASLGHSLAMAGRRRSSLQAFDAALSSVRGVTAAHVLVRRSAALLELGDDVGAHSDARRAQRILRAKGDQLWAARAHNNTAHALLGLGRLADADREYAKAQELADKSGQPYDAAIIVHSRADCAYRRGDLPAALRLLQAARDRYVALGVVPVELLRDRIKVLLAAGLESEAVADAESLVAAVTVDRSAAGIRAECLTLAASVLVEVRPDQARQLAARAAAAYQRQGHEVGERYARLVEVRARRRTEGPSRHLARVAMQTAGRVQDRQATEHLDGLLFAAALAREAGLDDLARTAWLEATQSRRRRAALPRAAGWLARARLAEMEGRRRDVLRACDAGLDVLEAHARSLGSTELRAAATSHGRELAGVAIREVLRSGSGRDLLRWTERWRATVLDHPSGRMAHDDEDLRDLAALRELVLQGGGTPAVAERERARLEERIRRRAHARTGTIVTAGRPASVDEIVSSLRRDTTLVATARVDGVAHVVVARDGRVRRYRAGEGEEIDRTTEFARFALRSAATGNGPTAAAMTAALEGQAERLQELLLGQAVRALGDGPVVVVPPARLQSIPWDAMPVLRDRPISVSPSASSWLRSCRATRPRQRRVALVTGPRLESAGAEVPELAQAYAQATVLRDGAATCDATMRALDGAWLAHVAAHGTIRTDNPMFSALELDDGPLTVYDLERLRRAPYRLVLSVCESAVGAATGADELLGLSSALIGLGTAGLLASIVPVNDKAAVPFSLTIHERLRAGDDLATALMHARRAAGDDPVAKATAYSFLALGAA